MSTSPDKDLGKVQLVDLYRQMRLIREFERESERQYTRGNIRGFLHVYSGEEAIAVGAMSTLTPEDYIVTHYRDHGQALARGISANEAMAELFGKSTGCSGGKGGSMHLFDAAKNFMGGYAIVGGQLPIATGLALASQYRDEKRVTLCFMGDGAINEGEFHESMNLASIWDLPIIFFCENNLYGMGSAVERAHAGGKDIYLTAEAYGIPAAQIDGMNLLEVREATTEALKRVRSGDGPVFIEAMTYRFRGHSIADPASYREAFEVEEWKTKDPISSFKELALSEGLIDEAEIARIDAEVAAIVEEAVRFAEESAEPDLESLYENVYG